MTKALVVVDMQNDFIDGALGTKEAQGIVSNVVNLIRGWHDPIFVTYDTHYDNYAETQEGRKLPVPHCVEDTPGWELNGQVDAALDEKKFHVYRFQKQTFGSWLLARSLSAHEFEEIVVVGLCSDICVISNALLIKAYMPEVPIKVYANCTAGVTPESNQAALTVMKMCQIEVVE